MASVAEPTAEAQLYERHADTVFRYCLRTLGSREDAEDAAQTTFFQAVRAMRRGVVPTYEQAWLLTIAKNECRSRHRANGRRRRLELVRDPQTLAEVAAAPNGADDMLVGVQRALTRLPETQRRALLLREWQGRSYSEIAAELGTTVPAVEALIFRARRALARELGEETKTRRHALDLASLLAAVKSALAGGAAVKVAAGLVAVATVATVAGGAEDGPVRRPVAEPRVAQVSAPTRSSRPVTATRARATGVVGGVTRRKPAEARRALEVGSPATSRSQAPVRPATPQPAASNANEARAGEAAGAPAVPPASAPTSAPALPPAPPLPQAPPLPEVPKVEVPKVEVPQVKLPEVSELPQLPQLPDVPEVPDLPAVPELPSP